MASTAAARDVVTALADSLRARAHPGGGWGYAPGKRSRVEPTSWAIVALDAAPGSAENWSPAPHLAFLREAQTAVGLLADSPASSPNYAFSALAALAARNAGTAPEEPWLRRLLEGLISGHGIALPASPSLRQDNALRAWPWVAGTFSWVEPTACGLLALKRVRTTLRDPRVEARIVEADSLLIDRCCAPGGWNYGNTAVLGQMLKPHVPTTAIALLALHDRRDDPAVEQSLRYLEAHARSEQSGMALALGMMALRRFGRPTAGVEEDLVAQFARTRFLENAHVMAMALYALSPARNGNGAFDV